MQNSIYFVYCKIFCKLYITRNVCGYINSLVYHKIFIINLSAHTLRLASLAIHTYIGGTYSCYYVGTTHNELLLFYMYIYPYVVGIFKGVRSEIIVVDDTDEV